MEKNQKITPAQTQQIPQDSNPGANDTQDAQTEFTKQQQRLFRSSALERVSSPDQLNDYIRVSNPSVWVMIIALIILLGALLFWSSNSTLPTTVSETCVAKDGILTGYLPEQGDILPGDSVQIGDMTGTVRSVSQKPLSSREISLHWNDDYTVYMLHLDDWNYEYTIDAPGVSDGLAEITIVTGEIKPITFIFN